MERDGDTVIFTLCVVIATLLLVVLVRDHTLAYTVRNAEGFIDIAALWTSVTTWLLGLWNYVFAVRNTNNLLVNPTLSDPPFVPSSVGADYDNTPTGWRRLPNQFLRLTPIQSYHVFLARPFPIPVANADTPTEPAELFAAGLIAFGALLEQTLTSLQVGAAYRVTGQAIPRTVNNTPPGILQVRIDGVDQFPAPFLVSQPVWVEHPVVIFTATSTTHTVTWVNVSTEAYTYVILTGLAVRRHW